jgi:hypothetical protein
MTLLHFLLLRVHRRRHLLYMHRRHLLLYVHRRLS